MATDLPPLYDENPTPCIFKDKPAFVKKAINSQVLYFEFNLHSRAYNLCRDSILQPYMFKDMQFYYEDTESPSVIDTFINCAPDQRVTMWEFLLHMANCFKTMANLHKAGIIHRNISLLSMYLSRSNRLQFGDFNCARSMNDKHDLQAQNVCYLRPPPECINQDWKKLDLFKQDVWCLGISLVYIWIKEIEPIDYSDPNFIHKCLKNSDRQINTILLGACNYNPAERMSMIELHDMTLQFIQEYRSDAEAEVIKTNSTLKSQRSDRLGLRNDLERLFAFKIPITMTISPRSAMRS